MVTFRPLSRLVIVAMPLRQTTAIREPLGRPVTRRKAGIAVADVEGRGAEARVWAPLPHPVSTTSAITSSLFTEASRTVAGKAAARRPVMPSRPTREQPHRHPYGAYGSGLEHSWAALSVTP